MPWFVTRLFPSFDSPLGLQEKALIDKLKVKQRGRSDGRRNYPDTREDRLSETEGRILAKFENAANELRQAWVDRWRRGGSKIDGLAFSAWEQDYVSPVTRAKAKMEQGRQHQRDRVIFARNAERSALRDLNLFQRKNDLDRDARYPDVPLMAVALLLSLTMAESAVNANLFSQVSDWGLLGGLGYAVVISLPNVLGGTAIGYFCVRAMLHVQWFAKSIGILTTATGISALVIYNIYISHFRAILATNPDASLGTVRTNMLSDPFAFMSSREAVILLFVGLVMMVLAIWKGMNGFSDVYWGYAAVDKKHKAAVKNYDQAKEIYRTNPQSAIEPAQAEIQLKTVGVDKKVAEVLNLTRETLHDLEIVQTALQASAHACRSALNTYRHENIMVRTTEKPAYFDEFPDFSEKLPKLTGLDFTSRRDQILGTANELHQRANSALQELREHAKAFVEGVEDDIREAEIETDRRRQRDRGESKNPAPYKQVTAT